MALIKKVFVVLSLLVMFTGCHNMTVDLKDTIGTTCWIDKLYWVDVSSKSDYSFSTASDEFKVVTDNGEPAIEASRTLGNWVLSSLGHDVKGYEIQIKCASGASLSGLQLFDTSNLRALEVNIKADGSLDIRYQDRKGVDTKIFNSKK